jgi:hypothetical protein
VTTESDRNLRSRTGAPPNDLALSRLKIDRLAGLPAGYSGKLLDKEGGALKAKRMWPASLEAILGTLGLQIIIVEDYAATSRTLSRRVPVDQASQRFDNKSNSKPRVSSGMAHDSAERPSREAASAWVLSAWAYKARGASVDASEGAA